MKVHGEDVLSVVYYYCVSECGCVFRERYQTAVGGFDFGTFPVGVVDAEVGSGVCAVDIEFVAEAQGDFSGCWSDEGFCEVECGAWGGSSGIDRCPGFVLGVIAE